MDPEKSGAWETQQALLPAVADDLIIDRIVGLLGYQQLCWTCLPGQGATTYSTVSTQCKYHF